ncbi:MAG: AraC family transcriptional regulator [Treponema sp.]|jgi:AraC-like DNA-binding protein|nr:AraC family transcriptional regulator [Treponema sp.]
MEPQFKFYYKNEFRPLASLSLHEIAGFECPPGYVLPLEKPDAYALYFVMYGSGIYTLEGTEFPVEENDIFAMYPNTGIKCRADKKDPFTLRAISFDGADARLLLNAARFQPKAPVRRLEDTVAEQIIQLMAAVYTFRGQDIYGVTQSTAMLYALMSLLVKTASWDQTAMPPGWTGAIHFQKALTYIAENYSRPITVNDIAEHVNLSRSRLYRVFLQQIFISPQQYLMEFRIREARSLLEKRTGSIKEIAQAVGIEDSLYFSKLFKQLTGKSPTSYMKYLIEGGKKDGEHIV